MGCALGARCPGRSRSSSPGSAAPSTVGATLCPEELPGTGAAGPWGVRCPARCGVCQRYLPAQEEVICLCAGGAKAGRFPDLPAWHAGRRCGRRASISRCCSPQKFSNRQINSEMVAVREQGAKEKKYSGRTRALWSHITAATMSSSAATHLITTETFINDTEKQ